MPASRSSSARSPAAKTRGRSGLKQKRRRYGITLDEVFEQWASDVGINKRSIEQDRLRYRMNIQGGYVAMKMRSFAALLVRALTIRIGSDGR